VLLAEGGRRSSLKFLRRARLLTRSKKRGSISWTWVRTACPYPRGPSVEDAFFDGDDVCVLVIIEFEDGSTHVDAECVDIEDVRFFDGRVF
jgi:hypothetical protein